MSEQIREQVSAFLDGELPNSETELLLKRLTRDADLRESFGRYALIGESLRGASHARLTQGFSARVNRAIDGEAVDANPRTTPGPRSGRWWRPVAGAAVAAGVAAVALVSFQQRAIAPLTAGAAATVQDSVGATGVAGPAAVRPGVAAHAVAAAAVATPGSTEAVSYTVPAAVSDAPRALPAARLTNYVFAHSKYSSVMGQNDVLNDLLVYSDAEDSPGGESTPRAAAPGASQDAHVGP